jgi:hypothetical protein
MDTPLIDTAVLFAESEETHVCCSCCEGYCPMTDSSGDAEWPWMHRIEVAGVAYLTDRYVAVRAELCQPVPDSVEVRTIPTVQDPAAKGFDVPEAQPPATEARLTAPMWDRIYRAGLMAHGEPMAGNGLRVLHLYRDDQHVGWVMTAVEGAGIKRGDLALIRKVAGAAGITLRQAEKAVRAVVGG